MPYVLAHVENIFALIRCVAITMWLRAHWRIHTFAHARTMHIAHHFVLA